MKRPLALVWMVLVVAAGIAGGFYLGQLDKTTDAPRACDEAMDVVPVIIRFAELVISATSGTDSAKYDDILGRTDIEDDCRESPQVPEACLRALDNLDRVRAVAWAAVIEAGRVRAAQPSSFQRQQGATGAVYSSADFVAALQEPAADALAAAASCR